MLEVEIEVWRMQWLDQLDSLPTPKRLDAYGEPEIRKAESHRHGRGWNPRGSG